MRAKEVICVVFPEAGVGGVKFTISARELQMNNKSQLGNLLQARIALAIRAHEEQTTTSVLYTPITGDSV
jgi:hypothetical protein